MAALVFVCFFDFSFVGWLVGFVCLLVCSFVCFVFALLFSFVVVCKISQGRGKIMQPINND